MPPVDCRQQLQEYLDRGLTPIPLKPRGKTPLKDFHWNSEAWNPKGIQDLEPYIDQGCNWAIRCGNGFYALDFDTTEAYTKFIRKNYSLGGNPLVRTGRGFHLYFWSGTPISIKDMGDGELHVRIQGEGSYVVAPPSVHPSGKAYRFITPLNGSLQEIEVNQLDFSYITAGKNGIRSRHKGNGGNGKNGGWDTERPYGLSIGVHKGIRHFTLHKLMGSLAGQDVSREDATKQLLQWDELNIGPLGEHYILKQIEFSWLTYVERDRSNRISPVQKVTYSSKVPLSNFLDRTFLQRSTDNTKVNFSTNTNLPDPSHQSLTPLAQVAPGAQDSWQTTPNGSKYAKCMQSSKLFRTVEDFSVIEAKHLRCNKNDCPNCGPYKKRKKVRNILEHTKGLSLYYVTCTREEWNSRLSKEAKRIGAREVRIDTSVRLSDLMASLPDGIKDGDLIVLTDQPLGQSIPLTQDLEEFLMQTIPDRCQPHKQPVSTSREWALPKKKKTHISIDGSTSVIPIYMRDKAAKKTGMWETPLWSRWKLLEGWDFSDAIKQLLNETTKLEERFLCYIESQPDPKAVFDKYHRMDRWYEKISREKKDDMWPEFLPRRALTY